MRGRRAVAVGRGCGKWRRRGSASIPLRRSAWRPKAAQLTDDGQHQRERPSPRAQHRGLTDQGHQSR